MVSGNETHTRALDRGLDILLLLLRDGEAFGVTEIARRTGLSKATAWRLLATLEGKGVIAQDHDRSYRISIGLLTLVTSLMRNVDIAAASDSFMRDISESTSETVGLYVRIGLIRVCVHQVESGHELRRVAKVGDPRPVTTGSVGRLFLAFAPDAEVEAVLAAQPLEPRTPFSPVEKKEFLELLQQIRRTGYATARDETTLGVAGMAVPILDSDGRVAAALNVSGPSERWTEERMQESLGSVKGAAAAVGSQLGMRLGSSNQRTASAAPEEVTT